LINTKKQYQSFCEREKEIPIFAQPWYLDAVCGEDGWDILLIKKADKIVASMPIQNYKKFGFQLRRIPQLTKYWGPYFVKDFRSDRQQKKLTMELIDQIPKFDYFHQNFHPNYTNALPLLWNDFKISIGYTFTIDLEHNIDAIFQKVNSKYRNNKLPKAKQLVQVVSDRSIQDFYDIQKMTFDRQKISLPLSFDFIEKYDRVLNEGNARKIFFAVDNKNQIHAVLYLMWVDSTAYLIMSGHNTQLRNSGAGILLTWEAIKFAKTVLNKKKFDFLGSILKPITKVREDFGAERVPYFIVKKFQSKLLKFLFLMKG